ncbi:MAG: hypothetical protein A2Z34_02850 [Planctomycetes bacterium RBG_16_59_8]|nr:MAG: hypothetical protein A2Z34_02850 [Planctomycetes bacterium RBG_16_59_8]
MDHAVGELPFCPGCGHHGVTKALDEALVSLRIDPRKTVIVTDIGCIGLSDRHFAVNAFHGLHGRAITYACGLKLARPELTVIAIMGDGGCGIGGAHLLNVARRNIGIALIVANNFNYGMTGGQHSVTTPEGALTASTPLGNVECPMDLCAVAAAAGAAWVCRTTTFEKNLPDLLAQAIRQPGFAMIDIWELCTAYYSPRNNVKKNDLYALLDRSGLALGVIADRPRPEYLASQRRAFETKGRAVRRDRPIEKRFAHGMERQTGIVIAGSAGQKIKSSATIFAQAAMFAGLEATQKDDYPITVMTGHSISEIILSPERIDYTGIETPDCLLVISEDGLAKVRSQIGALPSSTILYAEESLVLPPTQATVKRLPLIATSKSVDHRSIALIALSAMASDRRYFPLEALEAAVTAFQNPKLAELGLRAIRSAAGL